jgi:hypothetical protein
VSAGGGLGAEHGIASMSKLIAGVAAAAGARRDGRPVAIAAVVAVAMSALAVVSAPVRSQFDTGRAGPARAGAVRRDSAATQRAEPAAVHATRAVGPPDAQISAEHPMAKDAPAARARDDRGTSSASTACPVRAALPIAFTTVIGGFFAPAA